MKIRRSDLVGSLGTFAFLPLPLCIGAACFPEQRLLSLVPAFCYLFFEFLCRITVKNWRILTAAGSVAAQILIFLYVLPTGAGVWNVLPGLLYTVLLIIGLDNRRDRDQMLFRIGMIGIGAYVAAQIVILFRRNDPSSTLPAAQGMLTAGFFIFSMMEVPLRNRLAVDEAIQGRTGMPASLKRGNTVAAYVLLAVTFLIALIPQIGRALTDFWNGLKRGAVALAAWLGSLLPSEAPGSGGYSGTGEIPVFPMEEGEPSAASQVFEKIVMVIALTLAAAGILYLLIVVYRKLRVLLRRLTERIRQYLQAVGEDYTDEITDTRAGDAREYSERKRKKRGAWLRSERGLTPAQKVRRRYAVLLSRHPEWSPDRTARENLDHNGAELYERVRYGSGEVTEDEAAAYHPEPRRL